MWKAKCWEWLRHCYNSTCSTVPGEPWKECYFSDTLPPPVTLMWVRQWVHVWRLYCWNSSQKIEGSISGQICKLVSSSSSRTLCTNLCRFRVQSHEHFDITSPWWWRTWPVCVSTGGQILIVLNVHLMYGKSISCVSVTMVIASTSRLCLRERADQMMEKRKRNKCWIIL